jgi:Zn-dependent M28 family amino/carboxypeptidase
MTGSKETEVLVKQMAGLFREAGLQPLPGMEMIQSFEFVKSIEMGKINQAELLTDELPRKKVELKLGADFIPVNLSAVGNFESREVVFAGFGILAPALDQQPEYDSYGGLDLKGKWALIFADIPDLIPTDRKIFLNRFSRLHYKVSRAASLGAYGVILVNPRKSSTMKPLQLDRASVARSELPVIEISLAQAKALLQGHPVRRGNPSAQTPLKKLSSIGEILKLLDEGQIINGELVSAKGVKPRLSAIIDLTAIKAKGLNVVGYLPAARRSQDLVLIGAHLDHLGKGEVNSSLASGKARQEIHPGADDNASGVAAILLALNELSQRFKQKEWVPESNLGFALWTGEELGNLGSFAFLKEFKTTQSRNPQPFRLKAYLNSDMVGRLNEKLAVQGVGSAPEWVGLLEKASVQTQLAISLQSDPYHPTDSMAFYLKEIPALNFFTGPHQDYHTPRDTPDLLNYRGLAKVTNFKSRMAQALSLRSQKLTYQKVERTESSPGMRNMRIFLGTIPDYMEGEGQGLRISGTVKGSPAEKAGLKGGDVIQKLSQQPIRNIQDYMLILQSLRVGVPVEIEFLREGRVVKSKILPQPRAN